MNRLNIKATRKRIGGGKHASAPRGVLITWHLDKNVKQSLITEYFDTKDTQLLTKDIQIN